MAKLGDVFIILGTAVSEKIQTGYVGELAVLVQDADLERCHWDRGGQLLLPKDLGMSEYSWVSEVLYGGGAVDIVMMFYCRRRRGFLHLFI